VTDGDTLARIRSLAIPPAWTDVWISPSSRSHVQATGRDARGRKQYRYHPAFRRRRDAGKFDRLVSFGERLPRLRALVNRDLRKDGLPREKVVAAVVRLMELTLLRVGNEEYARLNRSFGLSTLRNRHAKVRGARIRFRFRGKGGQPQEVDVVDRRLAAVVRRCQDLPGQALFAYIEVADDATDGSTEGPTAAEPQPIDSADVNEYLREALGDERFSAKDLRTWAGTLVAFRALRSGGEVESDAAARRNVLDAIRETAAELGNTPAVARSSYVHPGVLEAYLDGDLPEPGPGSGAEARALLRVLRKRKALTGGRSSPASRSCKPRRAGTSAFGH
jgi:DNA topoisomerase I